MPSTPIGAVTLVQSADDPEVFLTFGSQHTQADVEAMRVDPDINILMSSMMALCLDGMRDACEAVKVIQDDEETPS